MNNWDKLYQENIKLINIYDEKYKESVPYFHEKNSLEFLIELGEFVNETKCFKYWTIKEPKREDLLEEYADCVTMVLYQYHYYGMKNVEIIETPDYEEATIEINDLYRVSTDLISNPTKAIAVEVFSRLIKLSKKFNITEEETFEYCYMKIDKNKERLASDY